MILTGIGDEAGNTIEAQIAATKELGWKHIEARGVEAPGFPKANLHDIPDKAFDIVERKLKENGTGVYCFGSTIMNWAKTVETPWDITLGEVKRCIARMKRLGTKFVRIMSFKPKEDDDRIPPVVFENCMNYGGMSWKHALELLDKAPGLKWVFDTANPVFNPDRSRPKPWPRQDAWEFWEHVRDHVAHIHVKDATWNPAKNDADYNWPGEGQGRVRDILKDALARGYDGGISIEPHMVIVFHDTNSQSNDDEMEKNYVEYGRRLEKLIKEAKRAVGSPSP